MWRLFLVLPGCMALWGQAAFKPNAQIGVPARVGAMATVSGSKEVLEIGLLSELTLESVELGLVFPNRVENLVATAEEKLLVVRGSRRNAEKTSGVGWGRAT